MRTARVGLVTILTATLLVGAACANDGTDDKGRSAATTSAPLSSTSRSTTAAGSSAPAPTAPLATVPLASARVRLREVATVDSPTAIVARASSSDLYVAERPGVIRRLRRTGATFDPDPTPVLDIGGDVRDLSSERGLLGLAFSPDGGTLYVSYTDGDDDGASVIARYSMRGAVADPASRTEVLRLAQPFANHNGGNIGFGPDGFLYVGFGDGGSQDDPSGNGQNPGVLLGKMLRIDPTDPPAGAGYAVPADNPFVATAGARPEIWLTGVRNPWRFSFDRVTGDLWIGDVGGAEWEEVDVLPTATGRGRGANLGWHLREGKHDTDERGPRPAGLVEPVFEYSHDEGSAITGGFVYRGASLPGLTGAYLFSDFSAATLRALRVEDGRVTEQATIPTTGATMEQVSTFGEGPDGEIYIGNLSGGILRIEPA
ncbi:MAG: PQQ-dependent sugar dehydrogenase [Acidimicrobiales bacterium]